MKFIQRFRSIILLASTICTALIASVIIHSLTGDDDLKYPTNFGPEIAGAIDDLIDWLVVNGEWFFDGINDNLKIVLNELREFLVWIPWPVMISLIFIMAWRLGSIKIGIASALGMVLIGLVNLWEPAMVTIAIMAVSVSIAVILGIPIGILMARSNLFEIILRPILDAMQTMPSFVYLVPGIMLFGLGNVAAILATVLYSIPQCTVT